MAVCKFISVCDTGALGILKGGWVPLQYRTVLFVQGRYSDLKNTSIQGAYMCSVIILQDVFWILDKSTFCMH